MHVLKDEPKLLQIACHFVNRRFMKYCSRYLGFKKNGKSKINDKFLYEF